MGELSTLYIFDSDNAMIFFAASAATIQLARVITPSILPQAKLRCYTSVVVNAKWLLLAGSTYAARLPHT